MSVSKLFVAILMICAVPTVFAGCGEDSDKSGSSKSAKSDKGADRHDYIQALHDINVNGKKQADAADPFQGEENPTPEAVAAYAKVYTDLADQIEALDVPKGAEKGNQLYADGMRGLGETYASVGEAIANASPDDPTGGMQKGSEIMDNIDTSKMDEATAAFKAAGFDDAADQVA